MANDKGNGQARRQPARDAIGVMAGASFCGEDTYNEEISQQQGKAHEPQ